MRLLAAFCGTVPSGTFSFTGSFSTWPTTMVTPTTPTTAALKYHLRMSGSFDSVSRIGCRSCPWNAGQDRHPVLRLACEDVGDDLLLVEFDAELVVDGQGVLAVHGRLQVQVPAQQVVGPVLAQVDAVLAQLRRRLADDH